MKTIFLNKENKILILLLLAGITFRLLLAPLSGFQIDINDWFAWAIRLNNLNFAQFYSKDIFTDYTPGYLYVLGLLGFLKNQLLIPDNNFYFLLKMPAIICDLIIGILIYQEVRKKVSLILALLALSLIVFNPAILFNSSIWGQIDSVLALFLLITLIALKDNHLILSSIMFGVAFLIKPQAIAIAPILAIYLVHHFKLSNIIKLTIPGLLIIFVLAVPFFPNQTTISLVQHILNTAGEYPYTSLNAYNFWGVVGFWIPDKTIWNNLSYQTIGIILFSSYWIILGYFYTRKKLSIYALATLAFLGFFFLPTKVHERYLYPALIFLILLSSLYRDRLLLVLTSLLTFLHFFNLYYVYVYFNEVYFQLPKLLYNPTVYNLLNENSKGLSLISFSLFILISINILKHEIAAKRS
ncbi:glycosyltransferase family 39 protein [Candidatus Daviesbacteria bacterium]|nr:glycosyltransferase family 39 protein [Candidatus Daviesbacteria bacterium]